MDHNAVISQIRQRMVEQAQSLMDMGLEPADILVAWAEALGELFAGCELPLDALTGSFGCALSTYHLTNALADVATANQEIETIAPTTLDPKPTRFH